MKRTHTLYKLVFATAIIILAEKASAQVVEMGPGDYYAHVINQRKRAMPLPFLRAADIVWEHGIWRAIDLREKFNQYFYFPTDPKGSEGRKNFAYMLWDAIVAEEIPIYEDDEFKIPIDNGQYVTEYTKADTVILEIVDDEDNYEYKTVLVPKDFNSEDILQIRLKEVWYIDKVTSEQHVIITGLTLTRDIYKEHEGENEFIGSVNLFWIPMLNPQVLDLFAQKEAYFEDNTAHLPTWEEIFKGRVFDSFITRESNRMNRSISDYLSGIDAMLEAERIDNKLRNISIDMWEY